MKTSKNPYSQEEKLFSVCTPIFGVTYKDLPKFAEHLSQQEYKNYEWVVVFDGPHKQGVKTMEKIKKQYPKMDISWYEKEHEGACAARNFGATKMKGEYLTFPGGDCYLYPEALRLWANAFEEDKEVYRVWGVYDLIKEDGSTMSFSLNIPNQGGKIWYPAFKYGPYADGTFPVRRDHFLPYDVNCKSLQDWEWSINMLKRDNFSGKGWKYLDHSFFAAELPKPGGLSDDSHQNWIDRTDYIRNKHNLPKSDLCVTSLGAPSHGWKVAEMLGADYLPMPSYKPHKYKAVYLVGFFTKEDAQAQAAGIYVTQAHMDVFRDFKGKKIVHWIGSDILQLYKNASFEKLELMKKWFKDNKIIHLAEADFTQKELKKFGIKAAIVPIPPTELCEVSPLPKQFTVGIYMPFQDQTPDHLYMPELTDQVVRSMPDVKFYFYGADQVKGSKEKNWEYIGYINYNEWMPKFSCNLRLTYHDGLPISSLQFLSAGRGAVTTVPVKYCEQVPLERKAVIEALRKIQKEGLNTKAADYVKKNFSVQGFKKSIWGLL
jgi:glycosyltransferase involved in cell wall biosynthesis